MTSTRMVVVNTSCRIGGKSRTIPSTQLTNSSTNNSQSSFASRCSNHHHHHHHHQSFDFIPTRTHVTSSPSSLPPSTLFNNIPSPKPFSPIVSSTTSSSTTTCRQENKRNLTLASAVFAFALGIFSATTLSENDPLSSSSSSSRSGSGSGSNHSNFNNNNPKRNNNSSGGGSGGGGGVRGVIGSSSTTLSQKNAERDIQRLEEDSSKHPYEVRPKEK